jgi:DNA-binding Lrp family transcriptional regulator
MLKDILKVLENDSRTTPDKLATMTGESIDEVKEQIEQAEQNRVILKYKTIINWDKIEDEQVAALIDVKVAPQRDVGFDSIAERIYRFPEAHSVYLMSGTYDLSVLVVGKTMHDVANFVTQKVSTIEGVHGTVTHFVLKRYKEDGEILEGAEEVKRQQVVP